MDLSSSIDMLHTSLKVLSSQNDHMENFSNQNQQYPIEISDNQSHLLDLDAHSQSHQRELIFGNHNPFLASDLQKKDIELSDSSSVFATDNSKRNNNSSIGEVIGDDIVDIDQETPDNIENTSPNTPVKCNKKDRRKETSKENLNSVVQLLKKSSTGVSNVLNVYEKDGCLNPSARTTLVHLLIESEKDKTFKNLKVGEIIDSWSIPCSKLQKWSNEIEEHFKYEKAATYYTAYTSEEGVRRPASGKLLDHYQYVRRKLIDNYSLKACRKKKSTIELKDIEESSDQDQISWLQNHSEPESRVLEVWNATFLIRQNLLKVDKLSVEQYLDKFPAIKINNGQNLIRADFISLFPNKENLFLEKWSLIRNRLIELIEKLPKKTFLKEDQPFAILLPTLSPENQDVLIFYLLLYILKGERKRKRKRTSNETEEELTDATIRSTNKEKRNSYLIHVTEVAHFEAELISIRQQCYKKKTTLQPTILIVGPLISVEKIYVIVNDIEYVAESFLHAVDLTFKSFFVFDCKYPEFSKAIWQFLQKSIYDINIRGERVLTSVNVLLGQVKHFLK